MKRRVRIGVMRWPAAPGGSGVRQALEQVREFLARIPAQSDTDTVPGVRVAQMHAVDHLTRLQSRLTPSEPVRRVLFDPHWERARGLLLETLKLSVAGLRGAAPEGWGRQVEQRAVALAELRRTERPRILQATAEGGFTPSLALDLLDAMRWLDRLGYHTWRISHYLGPEDPPEQPTIEDGELSERKPRVLRQRNPEKFQPGQRACLVKGAR